MMSKINWIGLRRSLYVFLIPIFFLLHGYNENFGLIPVNTFLALGGKYLLITFSIFFLSFLLLKKIDKAALFSLCVLLIFFFFGAFHDLLKTFTKGFLQSYTFLLPVIFCFVLVLFFLFRRSKNFSQKTVSFLNFLFLFLTLWELASYVFFTSSGKEKLNNLSGDPIQLSALPQLSASQKPDVFFIVLDEYTSSNCLREEFQYDNREIDSLLSSNGFFTSYNSRSNYNMTPFSLSSTLNGNYLKKETGNILVSNKVFSQAIKTFENNQLFYFFKSQGYSIKNYGCFNHEVAATATKPYFYSWDYNLIDNQTLYARVRRDIAWNFILKKDAPKANFLINEQKEKKAYHLYRNSSNWNSLSKEIQRTDVLPRFVYTHIMLPHEPFFLDENGKVIADSIVSLSKNAVKEGYLKQVTYTNSLLKKLIPLCAGNSKRPRAIIIEGDHGYRFFESAKNDDRVFRNLNTYYFSDKDYSSLYDGISPVNSFRVILNKYFSQKLPLLKDSTSYLKEPGE